MNKKAKKILRTVAAVIVALIVVGGAVWLITGRSPVAIIVKSALHQMDTDSYDTAMADQTDKSETEIPADVKFPREVVQYAIGNMQVFEVPAVNDTKPVVLYLHGGAYVHNFTSQHWKAMAEWAKTTSITSRPSTGRPWPNGPRPQAVASWRQTTRCCPSILPPRPIRS